MKFETCNRDDFAERTPSMKTTQWFPDIVPSFSQSNNGNTRSGVKNDTITFTSHIAKINSYIELLHKIILQNQRMCMLFNQRWL